MGPVVFFMACQGVANFTLILCLAYTFRTNNKNSKILHKHIEDRDKKIEELEKLLTNK